MSLSICIGIVIGLIYYVIRHWDKFLGNKREPDIKKFDGEFLYIGRIKGREYASHKGQIYERMPNGTWRQVEEK